MERLGEKSNIFCEVLSVTSAAGATSLSYSMENCDRITFICGMGTAAAATACSPGLTVVQSADVGLSTNAAVTGATGIVGPSTANQITNARSVLITVSTNATGTETVTLNGYSLGTVGESTLVSTAATALSFGSSVGATAEGGLAARGNSLSSVINNSTLSKWVTATTVSTAAIRLTAKDTASTGITVATTGTGYLLTSEKAFSVIEVNAADLNSTSKYVGLSISTCNTAVAMSVTVIKEGIRQMPPYQAAQTYKKST